MSEGESLPLSSWLMAHKSPFCTCNKPVSFRDARTRLHDGQPTLGLLLPRLKGHLASDWKARRITNIHPRRHHNLTLQIMVIGHDIIEQTVDDSTMRHTVIAGVLISRREFGAAHQRVLVSFQAELNLETYGILWAADETMIGRGIESHQMDTGNR